VKDSFYLVTVDGSRFTAFARLPFRTDEAARYPGASFDSRLFDGRPPCYP